MSYFIGRINRITDNKYVVLRKKETDPDSFEFNYPYFEMWNVDCWHHTLTPFSSVTPAYSTLEELVEKEMKVFPSLLMDMV